MNYTQILAQLSTLSNIASDSADFLTNLSYAFLYAEGRLTRDLDLLAATVRDASASTTASSRNFNLPTEYGTFLIVDGINVISPASTAPESGTRIRLQPVSLDYLDATWPSSTGSTVPAYFAYVTQDTFTSPAQSQIVFGPWPDNTYRVEVIGKVQPAGLSASNTTTWLSVNLPDLYIAACMVEISGYMRNYGAQADDPRMSSSWEQQYQALLASAQTYQARARFGGPSWTAKPVEPIAVPQRG